MSGIHILQFLLVVAILAVVGVPLFSRLPPRRLFTPVDPAQEKYSHLLVRKEEILLALKELEFDYETGKVSQADLEAMTQKLEAEALEILQAIDALEQTREQGKASAARRA